MKRRRKLRIAVLAALVLVLAGWLGGWFDGGGSGDADGDAATGRAEGVQRREPPADPETEVADGSQESETIDVLNGPHPASPEELPIATPTDSLDPSVLDRLTGCLSRVDHGRTSGDLPMAFAALVSARELPVPEGSWSDRVRKAGEALERTLTERLGAAWKRARNGRILATAGILGPLLESDNRELQARVRKSAEAAGWPAFPLRIEGAIEGNARPLAAGRAVRFAYGDAEVEGTVARQARDGQVSLRYTDGESVVFPVVARALCEPVEPDVADGQDQCLVALRAGDALRAGLWLGWLRTSGAADEIVDPLQSMLRQLD